MKESENCTFYGLEPETCLHLFVECNIIKCFWKEINRWLLSVTGTRIRLNNVEMIFGLEEELNPVLNYMDIVILKYKQYNFSL